MPCCPRCVVTVCLALTSFTLAWTPIIVKNVTFIGPQLSPDVTTVSRDGGYSALINENIVWLYDDTECHDLQGNQLSFVSNTAAYQRDTNNVSTVTDFGIVNLGKNQDGSQKTAILAGSTVGTGGWIPFVQDELDFNKQMIGKERVAIWPGTSPTPISTTSAFLYAPLVYVDYKPQDPSKEYQARGMTLIAITAQASGPIAIRQGDLIIPGTEVPFGGFSTLMGFKSTDAASDRDEGDMDVYLLGTTDAGLQLARAGLNDLNNFAKYTFWSPRNQTFSVDPPMPTVDDTTRIYLPGSFTSGSVFYSPYFTTFVMIYFNKMVDSTFYIRYLQLNEPLGQDKTWVAGGKNGKSIVAEDVEALVKYEWSAEQKLYESPTSKGGFNYAGNAHPEYFNTQYFPQSLHPRGTKPSRQRNEWHGSELVSEKEGGGDGKNLLLSWTSQKGDGIYQVELATLTFDDIPEVGASPSTTSTTEPAAASPTKTKGHTPDHIPVSSVFAVVEKGTAAPIPELSAVYHWCFLFAAASLMHSVVLGKVLF